MMTIREYALNILAEYGCQLDCYKGDFAKYALIDLEEESKSKSFDFPLADLAAELVAIGNEQPDKMPQRFAMIWDTDSYCDATYHDDIEEAKNAAIDTLVFWMYEGWCNPARSSADDWDYMIYNAGVRINEYNTESEKYDIEAWYPSSEDFDSIGWKLADEDGSAYKELRRFVER